MRFKYLSIMALLALSMNFYAHEKKPSPLAKGSIAAIDWYKENISTLNFTHCCFYPTCSQYTKQSIEKYGLLKGWIMGCDRLMRCNRDLWIYSEVVVEGELKKYDPVR